MEKETREKIMHITTRTIDIDPRRIKLLDLNARYMPHLVFKQLVENIQRDGTLLGNSPFCWKLHDDKTQQPILDKNGDPIYEVISGNHRVKASVAAGLKTIRVDVCDAYLDKDRRIAIQLSQNAITGMDDPATLKTIYTSIEDVTMRIYTGMDDKTLELMSDVSIAAMSEANLDFQTITMTFLPDEIEAVEQVLEAARQVAAGSRANWLLAMREYDAAMDALEAASTASGIRNTATAMMVVLSVFRAHLTDLSDQYLTATGDPTQAKRDVPIASIFGTYETHADVAARWHKFIQHHISAGDIQSPDEILSWIVNTHEHEGIVNDGSTITGAGEGTQEAETRGTA